MVLNDWLSSFRGSISSRVLKSWRKQARRQFKFERTSSRTEFLETRTLLTGPQLVNAIPNVGGPISQNEIRYDAPNEITLVFGDGQNIDPATLSGIQVRRAVDGVHGNSNDVVYSPLPTTNPTLYAGLGDQSNKVVLRFSENLPQDQYRIFIPGSGTLALKDTLGNNFNNGVNYSLDFQLNLGPQVSSVVPQPVVRNANGTLTWKQNQVDVYFNEGMNSAAAMQTSNYQLIDTVSGSIRLPVSVSYDSTLKKASLTFSSIPTGTWRLQVGANTEPNNTIETAVNAGRPFKNNDFVVNAQLGDQNGVNDVDLYRFEMSKVGTAVVTVVPQSSSLDTYLIAFDKNGNAVPYTSIPGAAGAPDKIVINAPGQGEYYVGVTSFGNWAYNIVNGTNALGGTGTGGYALRIQVGTELYTGNDNNSSYSTATPLGNLSTELSFSTSIQPQTQLQYPIPPGGIDEPGHRDIPPSPESHIGSSGTGTYTPTPIPVISYHFPDIYGQFPVGNDLHNAISPEQKQRAREIFELYSRIAGVQFVETASSGIAVITGDPRAFDPSIPQGVSIGGGGGVIISSAVDWGNSEYGGGWMNVAMHEIGHALGLGHSYDLPSIQGSGLGGVEPVFPGDVDIVHMQRLYPQDGSDIDLYKFDISQTGTFSAQISAEDMGSTLNSVLTLFRETIVDGKTVRTVIAQNDDYFGSDSYINLKLESGTYFIGVSAQGNSTYNPMVSDTGYGGRSDGAYKLTLKHQVDAQIGLTDTTGRVLDGNSDGVTGDVYNFWFQTGQTVFVDKNAVGVAGQTGSIDHPYDSYSKALQLMPSNTAVIRLVGNNGTDGNPLTPGDAKPYQFGRASNGTLLSDGEFLNVPKNVTVMIDAGAVLKFNKSMVNVGSFAQGDDRSGGALQVLGTPQSQVYFTSYNDDTLGGDSNQDSPVEITPALGDWGGIAFREDSDREAMGTFLSSVNYGQFSYGGGKVILNSNEQSYTPIHLIEARPAVTNNLITKNSTAAISADPNSFEETVDRIGPEIHGNRVTNNTMNALLIRISTQAGSPINKLDVSARFNETDITYVIPENLFINGNPGSYSNKSGRLKIDPGAIIKLNGSRIEATVGNSQLIAEGTKEHPIVFTSTSDDRYGSGGEFDAFEDGATLGSQGNWGGLVFDANSSGSLDYVLVSYAGGTTAIEGGFDRFNSVEIHQANVRIADSTLENNAAGKSSGSRNGRGSNSNTVIFVRGAQPIIVNNIIRNNGTETDPTTAISINANSQLDNNMADPGRTTGASERYSKFDGNFGPLVRLNQLANNQIDAMEVRGEEVLTGTVWDDTDIVHYVNNEVKLTQNFHTDSGLRLQSNEGQSLVIKLKGASAGFTVDGEPLEIDDRIGGSLHVLGRPGYPVVMTALSDDTVGAGFRPDGTPNRDTENNGAPDPDAGGGTPPPDTSTGPIVLVKASDNGNELRDVLLGSGITPVGNATFTGATATATTGSAGIFDNGYESIGIEAGIVLTTGNASNILGPNTADGATGLASGAGDNQLDATFGVTSRDTTALEFQFTSAGGDLFFNFVFASEEYNEFANSSFNDVFAFYIDGENIAFVPGTTTPISINTINGGDPLGTNPQNPQFYINNDPSDNGSKLNLFGLDGFTTKFTATKLGLSSGTHTIRMAISDVGDTALDTAVFIEAGSFSDTQGGTSDGEWRGIKIGEYSNDRNVAIVNEQEKPLTGGVEQNGTPNTAEYLGLLAKDTNSGDDYLRLGYQVNGFISPDGPGDADVYSFRAEAGTEVWIDIDQSSSSIDLVLDLLKSDGVAFARSLESQGPQINPILATPNLNELSTQVPYNGPSDDKVFPMTKETSEGGDYFGVNRRDPGMRVKLPGTPGQVNTYFIRVRSQAGLTEQYLADRKSVDLAKVDGGVTSGYYELGIRLRQRDEVPGTTVQYADIRYATNGIEILGGPQHSPLLGETAESTVGTGNETLETAQSIGNLLGSDRNTISVGGTLSGRTDVDFYKLEIDYQQIQQISGVNGAGKTWATVFDIDYADGLARPDTTISVFNSNGQLIFVGRDSNVFDDQGTGLTDLRGGSNGKLDAYIGSAQISEGTYYVAISTSGVRPTAIATTFDGTVASQARLEPISGVRRIVEDHIGFTGYTTGSAVANAVVAPTTAAILPISTIAELQTTVKGLTLADLTLYVSQANRLYYVNPFTGAQVANIGSLGTTGTDVVGDLAMRSDGVLYAYSGQLGDIANAGKLVVVDPATGAFGNTSDDAVADGVLTSDSVGAVAIQRNDVQNYLYYYSVNNPGTGRSQLFKANSTGSTAMDPNDPTIGPKGPIVEPGLNRVVGFTTGMAFLNNVLYGVSSTGEFYSINQNTGAATFIADLNIAFSGLANGPSNANNGAYANLLFATDTSGRLYALNTSGVLQPVFSGGATSINTGLSGTSGLAFSPMDFNLWHPTMRRSGDSGHGINQAPDNSRNYFPAFGINGRSTNERSGGASYYFGLEEWTSDPSSAYFTYGQNAQYGVTQQQQQDLTSNPNIGNNYNLPGGAKGALETNSFSLSSYSRGDKPTLYFNYYLETQDAQSSNSADAMRDSARVYVSTDNGTTWVMVATNNSERSGTTSQSELPFKDYDSSDATTRSTQGVQELFDNTGAWRQARIDLGAFAGNSNIKLRFEFSTSATLNGLSGDAFGKASDGASDNLHEGFYVDDIIVGFTERGEMVTGAVADTSFTETPLDSVPFAPVRYDVGPYQLEIRRGTEIGFQPVLSESTILIGSYDTNTRLVTTQGRLGDQNLVREQGSLQILNSVLSHSLENGIKAIGSRETDSDTPHLGSVRNLPVLNNLEQLAPGVLIANNVFYDNAASAIDLQGEATENAASSAVPFAKIVNNTIYGADAPAGIGIKVSNRAAPTILNNIISNTATGIDVDDSSKNVTVVGTSVFKGNTTNLTNITASNSFVLADTDPLFVNAANRNFYLASQSKAIDSSLNSLEDRVSQVAVKGGVGLPPAPILVPDRDIFGVVRADDPTVPNDTGLGANIFKDRGAIERIDRVSPSVSLLNPLDNGPSDLNPDPTIVVTHTPVLSQLVLQFADNGIGIDDSTVVAGNFTLTRNGVLLVEGTGGNFLFSYNPGTKQAFFTIIDTVAEDYVYELTLNRTSILDLAGNPLQQNRSNGTAAFTIAALNGQNDPPVNKVPGTQSVPEDTLLKFSTATGNAISVSDPDAAFGDNMVEVTLTVINGIMTIGTKAGLTFTSGDGSSDSTMTFRGTIPAVNNALQGLLYRGNVNFAGSDTLTIMTSDLGNFTLPAGPAKTDTDTITINVTPVNDAPVLDPSGNMTFTSIKENQISTPGNLVSEVILSAGGDRITDVDAGAVEGIAIHGVNNTAGQWEFSLNGGTNWSDISGVNSTHALLLASNSSTRIRFVPKEGFFGVSGITFAAWDQTSGNNGGFASLSTRGGATAFSTKNESAYITVTPIPHAISITNLGSQSNFVEKQPPVLVAPNAVVTDSQAPIFGGGRFTATLTANATVDDRLAIQNQGTGAGQIGVSGSNVSYGGTLFGTISGGSGSTPLVVTLNGSATQAAVEALVRNLTFSVLGPMPSPATRAIKLELRDVSDDTSLPVYKNLGVIPVNDPPTISADTSTEANYVVGLSPVNILPSAIVSDPDSPTFPGGSLTISMPGAASNDLLSIQNVGSGAGQISVFGTDIFYAGTKIGTYGGGNGANPLAVNFNGSASIAAVQQLIRNVVFSTINSVVPNGVRSVTFTLNDGSGGIATSTRSVRVFGGSLAGLTSSTSGIDAIFSEMPGVFLS